ncbi:GPI-anchored wall transfer protein 1 [Annulohypoxylon maeteangense]|uniref:GPI-anchored wall transfer protein 1 n=1 Tax=Annulohypoxylon maeteangense TaxID=1927788 RepID=UPI002007E53E|nr:GPI-anchored wall transfer protein 1 [Annulohypoxylon maeteangense]KAI0880072.1 GPI-anchored wall transfer protein 1 [Annulohypoxylon maeteangense]
MGSNATSYKQMKEDFVSNLTGGSVTEINNIVTVGPIAFALWSILQSRQSFFKPYKPLSFLIDFLLNVIAVLLAITLYANTTLLLCGLILVPAIFVYALPPNPAVSRKKPKLPPNAQTQKSSGALGVLSTKPFLTTYRGSMLVITCLAILAVDFRLFPRRFAKVETWGTSLMDVGVGSFVYSAGIVAARPVLKERAESRGAPLLHRLLYSMRHSLPLLILGIIRLISVKGLDYAEHVTEYGVHWNFFFTLGFLPPFVALFQSALKIIPSYAALAIILGVIYQVVLESTNLKAFILIAPRTDLFSMNREGICSFCGYLAIFLAGQDTGMFVLPRSINPRSGTSNSAQRTTLLLTMAVWTSIWTILYFFTTNYSYGLGLDVSRRLANLPYILWIAAFNSAQLFACCAIESVFFPSFHNATDIKTEREAYETATSKVLRSFNRNGLAIFLVANLLTGLVNMTVPTLDVGPAVTMGILVGYGAVLTALAVALDTWNVSIKL